MIALILSVAQTRARENPSTVSPAAGTSTFVIKQAVGYSASATSIPKVMLPVYATPYSYLPLITGLI